MNKLEPEVLDAITIVNQPLVDLKDLLDSMSRPDVYDLIKTLNAICIKSATVLEYMEKRYDGFDHDYAMKDSIKVRRRVRKALGYTFAADGLESF